MKTQTYGRSEHGSGGVYLRPTHSNEPYRQTNAVPPGGSYTFAKVTGVSMDPKNTQLGDLERRALINYRASRENGINIDSPKIPFPSDGQFRWEENVAKRQPPKKWYWVRYDEGPKDREWMEEKDRRYIARLARGDIRGVQEQRDAAEQQNHPVFRAERDITLCEQAAVQDLIQQLYDNNAVAVDMSTIFRLIEHPVLPARALSKDEMKQILHALAQNRSARTLQLCSDLNGTEEALADLILARPDLTIIPRAQDIPAVHTIVQKKQRETAVLYVITELLDNNTVTVDMSKILSPTVLPSISSRALSNDEMKQIFGALAENRSVRTLQLCSNLSGAEEALADLILARPDLNVTPRAQGIPAVHAIVQRKRQRAEQEAAERARRVIHECTSMLNDLLLKTPSFANKDLSNNVIVVEVAKLLNARTDFTALNLTNTNLSDIGWQIILGALRKNRVIKQIDFNRNAIPTEVKGQIDALLVLNQGERNLALEPLHLESRASFSYVLGLLADHAVITLNLNSFVLTAERAQILAEFIIRNRRLATLNLHRVQCIGDAGQILLEAMKQNTPLNIDFSDAQLDKVTVFILSEFVGNKPIVSINFTNCNIPTTGRNGLQTALQQNSLLQEVIGLPNVTRHVSSVPSRYEGRMFTPQHQSVSAQQSIGVGRSSDSATSQQQLKKS